MYNIPFSPPDISEEEIKEVTEVLRSGWITTGPKTKEFEKIIAKKCNTNRAVCLSSATACMEMILRLFGIGSGDEVITSAYTYTASASAIIHTGATPVLVDVVKNESDCYDSYEINYEQIKEKITEKTKAIIPVDIAGVPVDYEKILQIVEEKKALFKPGGNEYQKALGRVLILSDSAHGYGASRGGIMTGSLADFTSFSFHAVKNLVTAEGGALTWRDIEGLDNEKIYKDFMLFSLHGQSKDALAKTKLGAWEYDILFPAYKCNMTDVQAAIGIAQSRRYDDLLKRRKEIVTRYENGIDKINVISDKYKITYLKHYTDEYISSAHLFLTRVRNVTGEQRNTIIEKMAERGVATNVHYKPLPLLTAYKNLGFKMEDYENAYKLFECEVTLPLNTKLTDEEVDYIIEMYKEVVSEL